MITTLRLVNTSFASHSNHIFSVLTHLGSILQQISSVQYSIVNYSHHVLYYTCRMYSFYNRKCVTFGYLPITATFQSLVVINLLSTNLTF